MKFHIHAPIPPPRSWIASVEAESPPGFIRLIGGTVAPRTPRETAKTPGTALVPSEDIDGLPSQIQRLLQAFEQCDAASRLEVIAIAERLAGPA